MLVLAAAIETVSAAGMRFGVVMANTLEAVGVSPRKGIRDLWNAGLYENVEWSALDNPMVRATAKNPPKAVISWSDAKRLHKARIANGDRNYHVEAFIHCLVDDYEFDGVREGIWKKWDFFYKVASHFDGIAGIDFSTYADFPEPLKRYQFHKMRVMEHGANQRGIPVAPNARWGTEETWDYCFDALPVEGMLSVGTVGSGIRRIENRPVFEAGIRELVKRTRPSSLVVVGSDRHPVFRDLESEGIAIYQFDGKTSSYFKMRGGRDV